mmetsp:Transcript_14684/g.34645  ORF Transcript_14684/g.34645 Transcript_14684/m.34645 type:complete len:439 (-) Transcript_14684:183-1499(-)|eukprot:CAMPEP_0172611046 /NCGR_PEP_ID=MMETSP1068-20121228/30766_1 /TAXON_ID=35684 /ORGANISM="Pseudopedinella elastica, Strain CCMP716" /LENGTH=438 /DNA_ID=CAMNT_0013414909 /DNA_START=120 /DNA_END=1436 /DNA_ORIENTATION=+
MIPFAQINGANATVNSADSRSLCHHERKSNELNVEGMSIKELRALIARGGLSATACVERSDLISTAKRAKERLEEAANLRRRNGQTPVKLAVYDLSHGWARILSPIFLCRRIDLAPHTSIIIYGKEYFWGGSIQRMDHEDFVAQSGQKPVEIIHLGDTEIEEQLFNDFILDASGRYTQHTYDILSHNCNNFSQECAQFLLGVDIPCHILDAPEKLKSSCLGKIALFWSGLAPLVRTTVLLAGVWVLGAAGLISLAAMERGQGKSGGKGCPVAPGEESAVNFAVAVFALDVAYSTYLALCLAGAVRYRRPVLLLAGWVELVSPLLLAFFSYSSCVSLSTLHGAAWTLHTHGMCDYRNANYRKLSSGVAFAWLLLTVALATRIFTRVHVLVHELSLGPSTKKTDSPDTDPCFPFIEREEPVLSEPNGSDEAQRQNQFPGP